MTQVHATAIIHSDAEVDERAVIGPYCCVGKDVKLGKDVQLLSHVVVEGHTSIGDGTRVFPFASIGHEPQDLKYGGEQSNLVIGANNTIREQKY